MLALAAPRAMAKTYEVGTEDKFAEAVQEINKKSSDVENEIVLMQKITLDGDTTYTLSRGRTTIKGEGHKISIKSKAGITVAGGGTVLNLGANGYDKKLTIDGDTRNGFVSVLEGATANMYEHVTLQNRPSTDNACVVIMGSNSVFNMHGGVIEKCSRAVIAGSGATFHMFDGEIKDCRAGGNRVISVNGGSKFIMDGGTISGCTADKGGGLYADNSIVTINSGTISGCKARMGAGGGLYATNQSTITIKDGTISGCEAGAGGGLYVDGSTVTISGGTISGCEAAINEGGGLYATNQSTITISGGTISGCKAPSSDKGNGSGLYANNSTVTISGGTISGCDGRWGGGLYAENSSTIEISGGTISGCKVGAGGGLFVDSSTIRISGGIISECTTSDTGNGGGLYAKNSTIKITGGRIENNKAALGGGVALIGVTKFEKPITNWTVIGNEAYETGGTGGVGGGIHLENGSMDVSDGSNRIYNNKADRHGADIFLWNENAKIELPIAANMNVNYHDSGIKIDNWYNDNPRYTPSESGAVVEANKLLNGELSLVASYKAIPMCTVTIDANGGVGGSGSQTVPKGTDVTLEAPTKEGHLFKGWEDKEKGNSYPAGEDGKVKITVNENMKLTAVWEARSFTVTYVLLDGKTRTETAAYGKTVTLGEEPRTGYTFVGWKDGEKMYHAGETITVTGDMTLTAEWKKLPSAENLPKTGDESPVLLWGAALAVSAAACFMLRRRK
ncbi:MAG: InlB B-repeat-containing protein [Christensenellales bacterium]|nr:InlB B-repeat-containing protein [Christensenellales bacterium]